MVSYTYPEIVDYFGRTVILDWVEDTTHNGVELPSRGEARLLLSASDSSNGKLKHIIKATASADQLVMGDGKPATAEAYQLVMGDGKPATATETQLVLGSGAGYNVTVTDVIVDEEQTTKSGITRIDGDYYTLKNTTNTTNTTNTMVYLEPKLLDFGSPDSPKFISGYVRLRVNSDYYVTIPINFIYDPKYPGSSSGIIFTGVLVTFPASSSADDDFLVYATVASNFDRDHIEIKIRDLHEQELADERYCEIAPMGYRLTAHYRMVSDA